MKSNELLQYIIKTPKYYKVIFSGSLKIIYWFYCSHTFWEQVQNFRSFVTNRLKSAITCDCWSTYT